MAAWFRDRVGSPTPVQRATWAQVANGRHVLATAPTGSGKTLAAFLWAIDRLVRGVWTPGRIRVVYVSPLRALNNDIRRNLEEPLAQLGQAFLDQGLPAPAIRAQTRSGDTPQAERRRMLRAPPEILITTPESLNILLTTSGAAGLFAGVRCVVLDEVHALAGSKRGTHLITAVERLGLHAGEVQRLALSATVQPLDRIARWVGGWHAPGDTDAWQRRPVEVLDAGGPKDWDLIVDYPTAGQERPFWDVVGERLAERIEANRSCLIFGNSRRAVERAARGVNELVGEKRIWAHHGSLSRAVREVVEGRFKAGALAGIAATNSLELGIDVGAIDEVLLVMTPPSITSAIQRAGRAGHGVGLTSRARLYAAHPRDLLAGAVTARGLLEGAVEPLTPPVAPLDVLAQVILSMVAAEDWTADGLYEFVRQAAPYHDLPQEDFDAVLGMLAGRFGMAHLPALKGRLSWDRADGRLTARPGAARLVFMGGGTIPDRGLFDLRLAGSRAKIGTLDEEFVWERSEGDSFTLGVQTWRIQRITHNDVLVVPGSGAEAMAPFWRAEARDSGAWFAERVGRFLEQAGPRLADPGWIAELTDRHRFTSAAASELVDFLGRQRSATGCALPHRHHLVVERVADPTRRDPHGREARPVVVFHTTWGGKINRALALCLAAAWRREAGMGLDVTSDDLCVFVALPELPHDADLLSMVDPADLDDLVAEELPRTGLFGARFREAAGRALLLPRAGFRRRTPLWLTRQRAKELLAAVADQADFPISAEALRECLGEVLDVEGLRARLQEVAAGDIRVSRVTTSSPSPFAAEVAWQRTNGLMYEDDTPEGDKAKLSRSLVAQVGLSGALRPELDPELVQGFASKLARTAPGYAPDEPVEWIEYLKERLVLPTTEWTAFLEAVERDCQVAAEDLDAALADRALALMPPDPGAEALLLAAEDLPRTRRVLPHLSTWQTGALDLTGAPASEAALAAAAAVERSGAAEGDGPEAFLLDWLGLRGPVPVERLEALFGGEGFDLNQALENLATDERVVVDRLTRGASGPEVCTLSNLERLLRISRAAARPDFLARPAKELPAFLAAWQGLGREVAEADGVVGVQAALEPLFGWAAPAAAWEAELLPARLRPYRPAWLDALFSDTDLRWIGSGEQRVCLHLGAEGDLITVNSEDEEPLSDPAAGTLAAFPAGPGRYALADLARLSGLSSAELTAGLWELTWRGQVRADGFSALRRGIGSRFRAVDEPAQSRPGRPGRRGFARWKASRPLAGTWSLVEPAAPADDPLDAEQRNRERIRLLVDRHGLVFRSLLARELPAFRWGALFRSLLTMELSGEIVAGHFVEGVPGLQFASPRAIQALGKGPDPERLWWLNATDPASACGLGVEGLELPKRLAATHLIYLGSDLVGISERSGKKLALSLPPDHPRLSEALEVFAVQLTRAASPRKSITIETINKSPAAQSPYRATLAERFVCEASDGALRLTRRYS